jgi:hypothetical protein
MGEKALSRRALLAAGGAGLALPVLGAEEYAAAAGRGPARADLVVYGGTSAGVIAAVQMRRMGGTAVVLEPTRHIGGLTTSGLGATDTGNTAATGGLALEFYRRVCRARDLQSVTHQLIVREHVAPELCRGDRVHMRHKCAVPTRSDLLHPSHSAGTYGGPHAASVQLSPVPGPRPTRRVGTGVRVRTRRVQRHRACP